MKQNSADNIIVALVLVHANDADTCARFFSAEPLGNTLNIRYRLTIVIVIIANMTTLLSI